jgi:hypothetical protein
MVESKHKNVTLKKLARWSPSASSSSQKKTNSIAPLSSDAPFTPVHHEKLQQGSIYIIKVKQVSVGMFEGKSCHIRKGKVCSLTWSFVIARME